MKHNATTRFQLAAVAAACVAIAVGLQGCGSSAAPEPVIITVPSTPPVSVITSVAKYQVVLRNAATGALITDAVAIAISGAAAVDSTNAAVTTITTSTGLASFATAPSVAAGATLRVNTTSRVAGWADGSATVTVDASSDVQLITISLANTNNVAAVNASTAPVVAAVASAPVTGNVVTAVVTTTTPAKAVTSVVNTPAPIVPAAVTIPASTQITNAAGQTPSGAVTLAITAPSVATAEGQTAVPGGFLDAVGEPLEFAGLVSTTLQDGAGNRFTNFSAPVTVQMPIAVGAQRFDGSGPLVAGDEYPVSVWSEANSRWEYSATGVIKAVGGGLVAEFPTTSFSRRALIRARSAARMAGLPARFQTAPDRTRCTMTINFSGRPAGNTQAISVVARAVGRSASFNAITGNTATRANNWIDPGSTGSQAARIVAVRDSDNLELANFVTPDGCGAQTVALNFPAAPPTGSIVVSTTEQCANGTNGSPLPTSVTALSAVNAVRSGTTSAAGAFTFAAVAAGTYSVTAKSARTGVADLTQSVTVAAGAANANFVFTRPCTTTTVSGG